MKEILVFFCTALLACASPLKADGADQKERDRLGLTQEEWEVCKVLKLSSSKVRELLSSGITLDEYSGSPWLAMHITEEEWIALRRQGMKDVDIRQTRTVELQEEEEASGKGPPLTLVSFVLPGWGHYALNQKPLALVFAGISATSITLFFMHRRTVTLVDNSIEKHFQFHYLTLWLANSVICAGDVWRRTRYIENPELERFSLWTGPDEAGVRAQFCF